MANLGERIRELREMCGLGQRELDRIMGLKESTTWSVERSENVTTNTLKPYARFFRVSTDYLISGTGKRPTRAAVQAATKAARKEDSEKKAKGAA